MKSNIALKNSVFAALVAFGAIAPVAHAELVATPLRGDSRLVQFEFDEDNTFLVLAKPRAVTHLQFAADEQIQTVAAGDTQSWEIKHTKNLKNLFVKPKFEDITTSMTVITDKRNYQFVLKATADGKKWYQRVSWMYSDEGLIELEGTAVDAARGAPSMPRMPSAGIGAGAGVGAGADFSADASAPRVTPSMGFQRGGCGSGSASVNPASMKFNYNVEGDAPFKPRMIFNDGRFTYLQMPANLQELPALFGVIEDTDYSLVNYTVECDYLVAQRVLDAGVLKLGKAEIKFNTVKPKRGFFGTVEN